MARGLPQLDEGRPKDAPGRPRKPPLDVALALLAARARSRHEIEQALVQKGYPEAEREETLARLEALRYLDDAAFARDRARGLLEQGRLGPEGVLQRLIAHGIPEGDARQALATAAQALGFEPLEAARAVLARRPGASGGKKARARALRLLVGRGFSPEVAGEAAQALDCEGEED